MDSDGLTFFSIMTSIAVAGGLGYAVIVVVNALARRLGSGTGGAPAALESQVADLSRRLEHLESGPRLAEPEQIEARVTELEERLDFAERMLERQRELPIASPRA